MSKTINKKVNNTGAKKEEIKGAENMENKNLKALNDFAGTSKKTFEAIEVKELRPLEKHIMELKKKEAKNIDKTLENKINIRINWIESILENAENEILESLENEIAVTADSKQSKKLESVASPKNLNNKGKKAEKNSTTIQGEKKTTGAKKEDKQANTPATTNKDLKQAENEQKTTSNNKALAPAKMEDIEPDKKYYVELEHQETVQVVYINRTMESVVLIGDIGAIECDSKKFDAGIVYFEINKKPMCYSITNSFSK